MALYWRDVNGRNWPVCSCLKAWLPAYQNELLRVGEIKHGLDVFQAIGGAIASAGYHLYGGNVDDGQTSSRAIKIARNMGGAAFPRDSRDGMTPHCHIALKGCPHMGSGPRWQVTELQAGRNGLVNRAHDRGPRDGIKWPLRTYTQGIAWAKAQQPIDPMEEIMSWYKDKAEFERAIAERVLREGVESVLPESKGERYQLSTFVANDNANLWAIRRDIAALVKRLDAAEGVTPPKA